MSGGVSSRNFYPHCHTKFPVLEEGNRFTFIYPSGQSVEKRKEHCVALFSRQHFLSSHKICDVWCLGWSEANTVIVNSSHLEPFLTTRRGHGALSV